MGGGMVSRQSGVFSAALGEATFQLGPLVSVSVLTWFEAKGSCESPLTLKTQENGS